MELVTTANFSFTVIVLILGIIVGMKIQRMIDKKNSQK